MLIKCTWQNLEAVGCKEEKVSKGLWKWGRISDDDIKLKEQRKLATPPPKKKVKRKDWKVDNWIFRERLYLRNLTNEKEDKQQKGERGRERR